jgi:hypothetical protein
MKTCFTACRLLFFKIRPFGRSLAILGALLMLAGILAAQTPQIEWVRQFGTLAAVSDMATAIDAQGNIAVAGYSYGALPGQPSSSKGIFVCKFDADGNEFWTKQFGHVSKAYGISIDSLGNVYVAGLASGTELGQPCVGGTDAFVRKYDGNGNELWTRQFGTAETDACRDICMDSTGLYVTGFTWGILPGQTRAGASDGFVRKFDTEGNELWTHQFGSTDEETIIGISADATGVYIAGYSYVTGSNARNLFVNKFDALGNLLWTRPLLNNSSYWDLDIYAKTDGIYVVGSGTYNSGIIFKLESGGLNILWTRYLNAFVRSVSGDNSGIYVSGYTWYTLPGQNSFGNPDAFVLKYDASGTIVWTRQFGTEKEDSAFGVSADSQGVYVAGRTFGAFPGQNHIGTGEDDAFIRKYDVMGNEVWTRQFGGLGIAGDNVLAIDTQGYSFLAGQVGGPLPGQISYGQTDVYIRKYDATGNEIWTRQFGSIQQDVPRTICVDSVSVYVGGYAGGLLPGQTTEGAFLRKYDCDGTEIWTRQLANAQVLASSLDAQGNIYIAGQLWSTSGQNWDAFVRKYDPYGNENWTNQFGSAKEDCADAIYVDATGIYVSGHTTGTLPGQASSGLTDAFIRKCDFSGSEFWTIQFGTAGSDFANAICHNQTGVFVGGTTDRVLPGQTGAGLQDAFVRMFDPNGVELWTRQFGTNQFDTLSSICADSKGIYVAGDSYGTFPNQISAGNVDAFVRKYDYAGVEAWTYQFGTSGIDYCRDMAIDSTGILVAGHTGGTFPGQSSGGGQDAYVAKIRFNAPPVANAGANQVIEATGQTTSFSLNGTSSSDPDGDTLTYKWEDSSGNIVGESATITLERTLGTYTFKLTVTDSGELSSEDTVTITIQDTTPPAITAPADVTVDQSDPYGTPVTLGSPTVSDLCDPSPTVSDNAPDLFALGDTIVTWTATDDSGNSSTASQKVTVLPGSPANQLSNLTKLILYSVAAGAIEPELETSLLAKVAAASDALAKANPSAATVAMNDLKALVNQVEAQTDKKITPEIAAEIIAWANRVITDLGG